MNKPDVKKLVLLNLPYIFAFYFADKIAAVFRLAPGTEFIDKLTNGFAVFGTAFANPLPSFHPVDLLIGLIAGVLLKLAVYVERTLSQKSVRLFCEQKVIDEAKADAYVYGYELLISSVVSVLQW